MTKGHFLRETVYLNTKCQGDHSIKGKQTKTLFATLTFIYKTEQPKLEYNKLCSVRILLMLSEIFDMIYLDDRRSAYLYGTTVAKNKQNQQQAFYLQISRSTNNNSNNNNDKVNEF